MIIRGGGAEQVLLKLRVGGFEAGLGLFVARRQFLGSGLERGLTVEKSLAVAGGHVLFPQRPTAIKPGFAEQRTICVALDGGIEVIACIAEKVRGSGGVCMLSECFEKKFPGSDGQ